MTSPAQDIDAEIAAKWTPDRKALFTAICKEELNAPERGYVNAWELCDRLYAALRTPKEAGEVVVVPDGWVLVPREPTQAMKQAVRDVGGAEALGWALAGWTTMLAAVPVPRSPKTEAGQ